MAYDGKLLARARERLEQQRSDNQAEQQRRLSSVYLERLLSGKTPQLTEILISVSLSASAIFIS